MNERKNVWANRQILWGWLFLIAIILLLIYLFFAFMWPRSAISDVEAERAATATAATATAATEDAAQPEVKATMLAEAEATLASASLRPVDSVAEVMAAAQTVVAATVEVGQGSGAEDQPAATAEPPSDAEDDVPGLGWVDWVLGAIPGLTAMVTFVGLVVSSLMKWRSDLSSVSQTNIDLEREKIQFELQKQRHELDRVRTVMELEQQRLELELERERLALAQLRSRSNADALAEPVSPPDAGDDVDIPTAHNNEEGDA